MNTTDTIKLDDCHCCEGIKKIVPITIENPPGLTSINYRIGTHCQFKSTMLSTIEKTALGKLTTREDNDLSIALIDAWATVADVLTFYQERIANEGFLRTAIDRKSIVELARIAGYELQPGVAASTSLAFTTDDSIEAATIGVETRIQSVPKAGQTPQVFEVVEEIKASAKWNTLRPKSTQAQDISDSSTERFYFKGTNTMLKSGDLLLVVKGRGAKAKPLYLKKVAKIEENTESKITIVDAIVTTNNQYGNKFQVTDPDNQLIDLNSTTFTFDINKPDVKGLRYLLSFRWTESDLNSYSAKNNISIRDLFQIIDNMAPQLIAFNESDIHVYTFRIKSGTFGDNAPVREILPKKAQVKYDADVKSSRGTDGQDVSTVPIIGIDPNNKGKHKVRIFLDNSYPSVIPSTITEDSWIVLLSPGVPENNAPHAYSVFDTGEQSIAKFILTSKVTIITVNVNNDNDDLTNFKVRKTTVFLKSEELELAEKPVDDPLGSDKLILLDKAVEPLLTRGQAIAITGEIVDSQNEPQGISKSEVATIAWVDPLYGICTRLILEDKLENRYKPDTVVINANVAKATHGETKEEELGSGDPLQAQQKFVLRQKPLTYLSASTPTGVKSSLEISVDGVRWKEVPSLYNLKPGDHVYTVRRDEYMTATVIFGEGISGTKPTAGNENIHARYKIGTGIVGILEPEQLSLLMNKPLGVQAVTNPIGSEGAANPEYLNEAKWNAASRVRTMDRIVSITDVQNFALAFAGVGKSYAAWMRSSENKVARLVIATASGDIVNQTSELYKNLVEAIDKCKDPLVHITIEGFTKKIFNIVANIVLSPERKSEDVFFKIRGILQDQFSFESLNFYETISVSKVMAVIQRVEGVIGVDIDCLYLVGEKCKRNDVVPPSLEHDSGNLSEAWLLSLNPAPEGVILKEVGL